MVRKLFILIFVIFYSYSAIGLTKKNLSNDQLLCPTLLWGFEFISSDRVKVISTDLNKISKTTEYYYEVDLNLSFINIFSSNNNIRDRVFSIEINTLRIDVWTMTGGGFTTREMFPVGLCQFVEFNNLITYIENQK